MSQDSSTTELKMDPAELYREETFTDQRVGTIRRMTPVAANGDSDPSRPVIYLGQAQLMTPMGALPIVFEIDAAGLADAVAGFAAAAEAAMERTAREIEQARREAASSIVIPQGGGGGGIPGGGLPGGGIRLP